MMAPAGIRNGELICNGSPESSHQHLTPSQHLTSEDEQQEVGHTGVLRSSDIQCLMIVNKSNVFNTDLMCFVFLYCLPVATRCHHTPVQHSETSIGQAEGESIV